MNQVTPEQMFMIIGEQAVQIRLIREENARLQGEITKLKPVEVKEKE